MQAKALYQNTMFDYGIVQSQKVGQEVILKGGGGVSFLLVETTLPFAKLCYAFEEKSFFSVNMIL